jgi:hypothetical protein
MNQQPYSSSTLGLSKASIFPYRAQNETDRRSAELRYKVLTKSGGR